MPLTDHREPRVATGVRGSPRPRPPRHPWALLCLLAVAGCGKDDDDQLVETFDGLISEIRVDVAEVCFGHPVEVEVTTSQPAQVYIEGIPGDEATLSILGPLPERTLTVHAQAEGQASDTRTVTLDVVTCDDPWVTVFASNNPFRRDTVDFVAYTPPWVSPPSTYIWTFGDGQSATTEVPRVSHDYGGAMAPTERYSTFELKLAGDNGLAATETVALQSSVWVARSMGYLSTEVYCGPAGTSASDPVPDPGSDDAGQILVGGGGGGTPGVWIGNIDTPPEAVDADIALSIEVHNPHDTSITFDRYRRVYKPCDPDGSARWTDIDAHRLFGDPLLSQLQPFGFPVSLVTDDYGEVTSAGEVSVDAGATVTGDLIIEAATVPGDVCAVGYYLLGTADTGTVPQAVGSCFVELKDNPATTEVVTDLPTRQALTELMSDSDLQALSSEAVDQMVRAQILQRTVTGLEVVQ